VSRLLDIETGGATYAAAGVDIDAGDEAVERIKSVVASTHRAGVMGSIGDFGGLFNLGPIGIKNPILVSSADGVGTKLHVAQVAQRFEGVGHDLVAMLVDDLVCVGAEPLFLLDIITVGKLNPDRVATIVTSIAEGCRRANTALIGGETAEHGGVMGIDDIDVAGFAVGVLEDGTQLGAHRLSPGDALIGFHSPGIRSNGYTLARSVLMDGRPLDTPAWIGASTTLADELLRPSVIYAPAVVAIKKAIGNALHGVAHITGGGIVGNIPRMLPSHLDAAVDLTAFETPEIFFEIQRRGRVAADEMLRVFNCGLGMVLAVAPSEVESVIALAHEHGVVGTEIGAIRPGDGQVVLL
jgi:phosphoribosylformylglycinamidine cyclo-ligase